jgi:hypothetical protein
MWVSYCVHISYISVLVCFFLSTPWLRLKSVKWIEVPKRLRILCFHFRLGIWRIQKPQFFLCGEVLVSRSIKPAGLTQDFKLSLKIRRNTFILLVRRRFDLKSLELYQKLDKSFVLKHHTRCNTAAKQSSHTWLEIPCRSGVS